MPEPTRHLQPPGDPTADQPSAGATAGSTGEVTAAPGRTAGGPAGHPPPPIPGYELLEEIGRGGMGVVYRAKDLALGRDVAVKLLQDQYPADGIAARRFDREARITGGLQHPGVPAVYQAGALPGGRPFLAMKLIQGRTLDALIRDPAADRGRLVGAFEGVCQAVGCAHSRGVVHRDLKPANVMVGAFGEVQVMDWGLAKEPAGGDPPDDPPPAAPSWPWDELAGVAESTGSTVTGSVLGTPAFMPPEQARGETGAVGARADVFGLGAVLCAVLTGRPPYHGDAAGAAHRLAVRADLAGAFARLDACGADPELIALCRRCLSPDPAGRPADGGAVAAAVAAHRAGVEARLRRAEVDAAAAAARAAEERKRRRVRLALGSAVLLTLLAGGAAAGWQWRRAEAALAGVTAERGKVEDALARVTEEQGRTAAALAAVTAEGAAKDEARRRARANLRKLTDEAVGERLGRQPALTARDRQLLRDILGLWEELAAGRDDPDAEAARAEGAYRVGMVRYRLGELADAERALRAAAGGWDREAAAAPADPRHPADAARCRSNLGSVLRDAGRPGEAEAAYRAGAAGLAALADAHPDDPSYRDHLARVNNNLGLLFQQLRRYDEAAAAYRAALAARAVLVAARPDDPTHPFLKAGTLTNLGRALDLTGRPRAAEAVYREAVAVLDRLAAAHPDAPDYPNVLSAAQSNLGLVLRRTGRPGEAEAAFRAAVGLLDRLAAAYPAVPQYQDDLAGTLAELGGVLREEGRFADAEAAFREAIRVRPKRLYLRTRLGLMLLDAGDPAGAAAVYREAARLFPDDRAVRADLATIERVAALVGRLPGVAAGADRPASPAEAVELADQAAQPLVRRFGLAARLYAEAFAADPGLARGVGGNRYNAACAALRAAAGEDPTAAVGWDEWGQLHDRAHAWLTADLAALRGAARSPVRAAPRRAAGVLAQWLTDPDLVSVRDPARRAGMPAPDRERWERLWAEVEGVRAALAPPAAPPPREAVR